jgi:methyl-accepting chemotaxis protein
MADTKIKITAQTAEAERALGSLGRSVVGLNGNFSSLTGVAGALGGALSIGAFGAFIKSSIDSADSLNDLSKVTKLTVEQLAGVSLAAKQSGSDLAGTANSISKLSENIGKDSEKFAALGITARDPIEAFKQLADVYNAIDDPQKQAAFGAAALGKSWKEAAPLLAEGSERIGQMIERGTALSGNVKDDRYRHRHE